MTGMKRDLGASQGESPHVAPEHNYGTSMHFPYCRDGRCTGCIPPSTVGPFHGGQCACEDCMSIDIDDGGGQPCVDNCGDPPTTATNSVRCPRRRLNPAALGDWVDQGVSLVATEQYDAFAGRCGELSHRQLVDALMLACARLVGFTGQRAAVTLLAEVGLEWSGEYGFSAPERARRVWEAVADLRPGLIDERSQ